MNQFLVSCWRKVGEMEEAEDEDEDDDVALSVSEY